MDLQTNLEDNTNQSKKEKEKAEGRKIVEDTEAGLEDKTEDKDETEDELEDLPEDTPAWAMKLLAKFDSINVHADRAIKNNFKAFKDIGNKTEDILRPCTSANTENAADALLPVRTVRVPAHQISDRKFVTVGRQRRKHKEYQTDCKPS